MKIHVLGFICMGLIYSVIAIAYMHSSFIEKDYMELVLDRLNRIEDKIDKKKGGN